MAVSQLRQILNYIQRFRNRTVVLNIDSAVVIHENFANLLLDISVLRSMAIDVVVVHGASCEIARLAPTMGVCPSSLDGMGQTDLPTLELSILAATRVTHQFLQGFSSADTRAAVSNAIVAHPFGIIGGTDQLWTGRVERVDTVFIRQLLEQDIVPVIPPLGFDGDGRTFRVNSDGVAMEVAIALQAAKLIFVGTESGVPGPDGLAAQMPVAVAEEWLRKSKSTQASPALLSKIRHGVEACKKGVPRVHIINGCQDEALLTEIFSERGSGSMIHANEYQSIRKAMKKDLRTIWNLVKESARNEELIQRQRQEVERLIPHLHVFEIDRHVVGCVALLPFDDRPEEAELACLVVDDRYENQGIGTALTRFVEKKAAHEGIQRLFALSTQAFNFFTQKAGFQEGSIELLPPSRRERYANSKRNSRILYKDLKA